MCGFSESTPEEYDNRKFVEAPVWIATLEDARAGIAMLARPRLRNPDYSQGFAPPPADFTDRTRVYMELDKRAYEHREAYRKTQPAKPL
jgi:hypothetical protein